MSFQQAKKNTYIHAKVPRWETSGKYVTVTAQRGALDQIHCPWNLFTRNKEQRKQLFK